MTTITRFDGIQAYGTFTKQQAIAVLKKSHKISEFIVKKEKILVEYLSASTDEFIKDILEVIKEEVNVDLGQIASVKELEQTLKANKYIHSVDNVLPDLELKERTVGFFESLGAYRFKEEIRMCKSLFYESCTNFVLLPFGVLNYKIISLAKIHKRILIDQSG
ncbi:hypothetical protein PHYBLDRAFT_172499 [Phycomyces blakesleeanus NRRL 1555(-)]|uniref:Uncharacterized protein n=1 Tax=Phycomyces blakesleeanus (strain ATCC 8743b / DSM 1359 / FGSC 10004 / NBRC 33097 / NRRL 1555) TaxID=763407 RepID=A0A162WNG8_PHYB8|nr:hypothetical protein PHYBLDRAFT_172499 [Phycomyces blakesleeanus NRRL 1555(-)]OAD69245.1 hypothetical protein PHYBLDRAFT_172499 [Phycomyces blakesleeanus NRRL 1555(-)]|eukprot:XP_018287285.1 hypothetical protein PHYBLDRAFT_172499 [Phycomyces blakesleeanus NRRL 1555(-)]